VGAVVGSHTSPGRSVVVVGGGLLAGGLEDELHPYAAIAVSRAMPPRVARFMK